MFGTKWKGDYVVVKTGISASSRRKAIKEAGKHGYVPHTEGPTSITFKRAA